MATPQQNKEIVYRFNKGFIEQGDEVIFNDTIDDHFINQTAPPGVPQGPEGVRYFFNQILRPAFPDLVVQIYDQVAEDDKVVTRKAFLATHQGLFLGIPASQKKVVIDVIDIIRLRDGKFIEHWNILDLQSVLMQIQS